jgi:hypothetical protein
MNTRLLIPLALAAAILACGGDEEASLPEPTDSPPERTAPAPRTPAPSTTPPGMTDTDHWFHGVVTDMNTGCYVDAICSVTVEVTETLGGAPLEKGTEIVVITSYGFSTVMCEGQWAETPPGREVEVLAHPAEGGTLAICGGNHYFVKDLQVPE